MAARRGLIPHTRLAFALALVVACGSGGSDRGDEDVAPTVGRGTRVDPPEGISPPASGSSSGSSGFTPIAGCPSKRTEGAATSPLTEDELRLRAVGIYRSCATPEGLEIRIDAESNELHWYLLDDRFVRRPSPGFDGPLEVEACEDDHCTVKWIEPDVANPVTTVFRLSLWSDPTALFFSEVDRPYVQEWVRIAD